LEKAIRRRRLAVLPAYSSINVTYQQVGSTIRALSGSCW
jgi:hypothetical protein